MKWLIPLIALVLLSGCIEPVIDAGSGFAPVNKPNTPSDERFHNVQSLVPGVAQHIFSDADVPLDVRHGKNKGHGTYIISSRGKSVYNSQLIFNTHEYTNLTGTLIGQGYYDHYEKGMFRERIFFYFDCKSEYFVVNVKKFSENVFGGITGQSTTTVEGVSSGESIEVCGGNYCNVTEVEVNITNTQLYYDEITINHSGTLIDYQVAIETNNETEQRFYNSTGDNLSYWNQSDTNITWVKINLNNGDTVFRRYYGNTGFNSESSIYDTGINGSDDFSTDLSRWTVTDSGSNINIGSGVLTIAGNTGWNTNYLLSDLTFDRTVNNFVIETKIKASAYSAAIWGYGDNSVAGEDYSFYDAATLRYRTTAWPSFTAVLPSVDTYYTTKLMSINSSTIRYEYDGETHDYSDSANNKPLYITHYGAGTSTLDYIFLHKKAAIEPTEISRGTHNVYANITVGTSNGTNHNITDGAFNESFAVQNINNVTTYWDGYGTATVQVTVYTTDDPLQTTKTYANGYKNGTMYINHDANFTNVTATANLDNSSVEYSGTVVNLSNDQNVTDIIYNTTNVIWNSTQVNNSVTHWYNFSLPVNNASINAQANQTCEWNWACTIATSASDVDNNTIYWNTTINGTTVSGETPEFTNVTQLSLGTHDLLSSVSDHNGTITTAEANWPFSNLSKVLTVSDTIAPPPCTNIGNTKGDYWVNFTCGLPTVSDFSHLEVWINSVFNSNITVPHFNYTASEGQTVNLELKSVDVRNNINATTVTDSVTMNTTAQVNQISGGW